MSAIGVGSGGQIESVIRQMIEQALDGSLVTSSGGDSPKTNKFITIGELSGFSTIIDSVIQSAVADAVNERGDANGGGNTPDGSSSGAGVSDALGFASSAARSPTGALLSLSQKLLPILGPAMVPLILPQIVESTINLLTQPGRPLDPRFKRIIQNEILAGLERQTQEDSRVGRRNIIIQAKAGYMNLGGAGNNSIMRQIKEGTGGGPRVSGFGLKEHAMGVR